MQDFVGLIGTKGEFSMTSMAAAERLVRLLSEHAIILAFRTHLKRERTDLFVSR